MVPTSAAHRLICPVKCSDTHTILLHHNSLGQIDTHVCLSGWMPGPVLDSVLSSHVAMDDVVCLLVLRDVPVGSISIYR